MEWRVPPCPPPPTLYAVIHQYTTITQHPLSSNSASTNVSRIKGDRALDVEFMKTLLDLTYDDLTYKYIFGDSVHNTMECGIYLTFSSLVGLESDSTEY